MKKKVLNTVVKKYMFGSVLAIFFLVVSFVTSVSSIVFLSKEYHGLMQNLIAINNLERLTKMLNTDVEKAAVYFQEEGLRDYFQDKENLDTALGMIKEQTQKEYVRSLNDLFATIETYVDSTEDFIDRLQRYEQSLGNSSELNIELSGNYDNILETYTYIIMAFQNAYTNELALVERNAVRTEKLYHSIIVFLAVLLFTISIGFWLYVRFMLHDIKHSISQIMAGVESFQQNIKEADPIVIGSGDEFDNLAEAFNEMQAIIREQMDKIAEDAHIRVLLTEAENKNLKMYGDLQKSHLDFLQSRINPHFLFNTLNMISSMAIIENAEKTAELMMTTASFLRYNLDNISKRVTLEKEIDNLKEYIAIQKYRYGTRFSYEYRIEEATKSLYMPSMILQPLVENSIQHGIGMMRSGGVVSVLTKQMDNFVVIEVRDNGVGMDEEKIRQFMNHEMAGSHIGLSNIFQRLQLFYGEEAKIEITNVYPGLDVQIKVPYDTSMYLEQMVKDGGET